MIPVLLGINVTAAAFAALNLLGIGFLFLFRPRTVRIEIFDQATWNVLWALLALLLLLRARNDPLAHKSTLAVPLSMLAASATFFILPKMFAPILVLSTVLLVTATTAFPRKFLGLQRRETLILVAQSALVTIILIELASIAAWLAYPLVGGYPFDGRSYWSISLAALSLFYAGFQLGPILLLVFLTSWIWSPLVWRIGGRHLRNVHSKTLSLPARPEVIVPLVIVALNALMGFYAMANLRRPIGADAVKYLQFMSTQIDPATTQNLLLKNARGGYILFLYAIKTVFGLDPLTAVNIEPFVVGTLTSLATFYLIKTMSRDLALMVSAPVLMTFSAHASIGMLYGSYPSWLALGESLAFLAFLVRAEMKSSLRYLVAAQLALTASIFTHYWTWGVMMGVLAIYLVLRAIRERGVRIWFFEVGQPRLSLSTAMVLLFLNIAAAAIILPYTFTFDISFRQVFTGSTRVDIGWTRTTFLDLLTTIWSTVSYERLSRVLGTISYSLNQVGGGFFNNPIVFALAILGMIFSKDYEERLVLLVASWVALTMILSLLIDPFLQWRLLYLLPYEIAAAMGIVSIARRFASADAERIASVFSYAPLLVVLLIAANQTFMVVAHLFILLPAF